MKFLDYICSTIYIFFEKFKNDRPGDVESPIFATIFVLTMLSTLNVLSFFSPDTIIAKGRIFYISVVFSCCFFTLRYYYKKRYINIVDQFKSKNNKGLYYFITVVYIIISIVVFDMTN